MIGRRTSGLSWAFVAALLATACPPTRAELACPEGLRGCQCQNGGCKLSSLVCVEDVCVDATGMAGSAGSSCSGGGRAATGGEASDDSEAGAGSEDACVATECAESYCEFLESFCSWELERDHGGCPPDYADCPACVVHFDDAAMREPDRYCREVFYCWHGCVVSNSSLGDSLVEECIREECAGVGCAG